MLQKIRIFVYFLTKDVAVLTHFWVVMYIQPFYFFIVSISQVVHFHLWQLKIIKLVASDRAFLESLVWETTRGSLQEQKIIAIDKIISWWWFNITTSLASYSLFIRVLDLEMQWSQVHVLLWPLAEFVLGCLLFSSSAVLANGNLLCLPQVRIL